MLSSAFAVLAAAASLALASTPVGFVPSSNNQLVIDYGSLSIATSATLVDRLQTLNQPTIGLLGRPSGTEFAVIMVDLDIPTNSPPQTSTLLHWMQTGLTAAAQATRLGNNNVLLLQNAGGTVAAAPYIAPNPPNRVPVSHRYTLILVDTTGLQAAGLNALNNAARTRQGFVVNTVLTQAGLQNRVVAGNFFNVTFNPNEANATDGSGQGTGVGVGGPLPTDDGGNVLPAAGSVVTPAMVGVVALAAAVGALAVF